MARFIDRLGKRAGFVPIAEHRLVLLEHGTTIAALAHARRERDNFERQLVAARGEITVLRQIASERDGLLGRVAAAEALRDRFERDWYDAKAEFGQASAKLRERIRELEAARPAPPLGVAHPLENCPCGCGCVKAGT